MNKPVPASPAQKLVHDVTAATMWDYTFQAKIYSGKEVFIIASDSLRKLKQEVRERGWRGPVWLTTTKGSFSYGQNVVDEYPYCPRC